MYLNENNIAHANERKHKKNSKFVTKIHQKKNKNENKKILHLLKNNKTKKLPLICFCFCLLWAFFSIDIQTDMVTSRKQLKKT